MRSRFWLTVGVLMLVLILLAAERVEALRRGTDQAAAPLKDQTLGPDPAAAEAEEQWWSLRPLHCPPLPRVKDAGWVRTAIDVFILAMLESKGLSPAPAVDRVTFIRRATFDLHGLPPTPEEIEAFVNDSSPDAFEKVIDRLLASPRYGERWGRHWLDIVHYADTHGYDKDKRRLWAWLFRDWVIRAFNQDLPYRRFVRQQIAGDVLTPDDPEGVVATGFLAAGPWDFVGHVELREGTVEKEKTRLLDRDDMVSNTISTFVSLTAHCARCHDHKFDPIPQKDYYRLQAVFAGVERGDRPFFSKQAHEEQLFLELVTQIQLEGLQRKVAGLSSPELERCEARLKTWRERLTALPSVATGKRSPTNGYHSAIERKQDVEKWVQVDLGASVAIDEIRLLPARPTDFKDTPGFGFPLRFRVAISEDATFARGEVVADCIAADFPNPGNEAYLVRLKSKQARFVRVTATKLWPRAGDYVFALAELQVDSGGKNIALKAAVNARDSIEAGRWSKRYLVDNYDSRDLLPDLSDPKIAAVMLQRRDFLVRIQQGEDERRKLLDSLIDPATRAALAQTEAELKNLTKKRQALETSTKVYTVIPRPPRPIHVLHRGDVEKKRALVGPGTLSLLPGLKAEFALANPNDEGSRRVALADWLTDDRNVLTWRSIVNRIWQYHFGRGLVDTPNDFGKNGSRPTHPELLDWLAVSFRDGGGSFKQLHRTIMLSATYRQSCRHNEAHARIDSDNRFLWRMNRQRLDAEAVRDSILAVSGRLDSQMGGPGFKLFRFKDDHSPIYDHSAVEKINDPKTWRRTVYRFTVRSVPNPFLEAMDCADPNISVPVRNTTVTALQALALLNNPFVMKQSELFAERLQKISADPEDQIEAAYRLAFGRPPTREESEALGTYARRRGLQAVCRLLFNANEFLFID